MWWLALLVIPAYLLLKGSTPACANPLVSSRVNLHTHSICLTAGQPTYTTTRNFDHTHTVDLTDALTRGSLSANGAITVPSSIDAGHSHNFVITPADIEAAGKRGIPAPPV